MTSMDSLQRIRSVADYQFGSGSGIMLFPDSVEIKHSKATGRIRYINLKGERLATLRPTDGLLSLSIAAARSMVEDFGFSGCLVTVRNDVSEFVSKGGDVFAVHVVRVDDSVRAKDEVIVIDTSGKVMAVGRASLSSYEMRAFKKGVAVKVRHGSSQ